MQVSAPLVCHACAYDLRATPGEGVCPECGVSVAESAQVAAVPVRPAWGASDPRWRRRMVAGVWVLSCLPLMAFLQAYRLLESIPVPNVFSIRGTVSHLGDTMLGNHGIYEPVIFNMGMVLLFSKERGRRRGRWDWTRKWGVLGSYIVAVLSMAGMLFLCALVLVGIAALFQSMPLRFQPSWTHLAAWMGGTYLKYGPQPKPAAAQVCIAFSALLVLLGCAGLSNALRSCGGRWGPRAMLAPLVLCAMANLGDVGARCVGMKGLFVMEPGRQEVFFDPQAIVQRMRYGAGFGDFVVAVETAKWLAVLAIAVRLTQAQWAAWVGRRHAVVGAAITSPTSISRDGS